MLWGVAEGFDLVAAVAEGVRDRESAWRFVRGYAAHWLRPLRPGDGCDAAELAAMRRRLSTGHPRIGRLPAALMETHALLGRRRDLTSNQDRPLRPHQVHVDDPGQVLVLRIENQGRARWGIHVADLTRDDPSVLMHVAADPHTWIPYAPRWSTACLEMVLSESLFGDPDPRRDTDPLWDTELDEDAVTALRTHHRRLPVPDLPHWTLPDVRWHAGPDLPPREEARTWLWTRGHTPQALESLRHALSP